MAALQNGHVYTNSCSWVSLCFPRGASLGGAGGGLVALLGSTAASMLSRPGLCGVVAAVPFAQTASALRLSITGGGRRHRGGSP